MRIAAIADLHGHLPAIDQVDLLLIAGDVCLVTNHHPLMQHGFLDGAFRRWLDHVSARHVVGIAGNHDFIFQQAPHLIPRGLRWTYLRDQSVEIGGLNIWGTPWQPIFRNWAFNLAEPELAAKWAMIPDDTDILLAHGPPRGFGDYTLDRVNAGSPSLRDRIERMKPKLTVFGHVHEGYGRWDVDWGTMANVSLRDAAYRVVNEPMYFDVDSPLIVRLPAGH